MDGLIYNCKFTILVGHEGAEVSPPSHLSHEGRMHFGGP
jgi:hypothetical protein